MASLCHATTRKHSSWPYKKAVCQWVMTFCHSQPSRRLYHLGTWFSNSEIEGRCSCIQCIILAPPPPATLQVVPLYPVGLHRFLILVSWKIFYFLFHMKVKFAVASFLPNLIFFTFLYYTNISYSFSYNWEESSKIKLQKVKKGLEELY
jgi:hypothetical protein